MTVISLKRVVRRGWGRVAGACDVFLYSFTSQGNTEYRLSCLKLKIQSA